MRGLAAITPPVRGLLAFRPKERKAVVRYLTFSPPSETTIKILQAKALQKNELNSDGKPNPDRR
jgi:hypothetical protein